MNSTILFSKFMIQYQNMNKLPPTIRLITIDDYDQMFELWNSTEQSKRALNPVDDSRQGIDCYIKRNPTTCFGAFLGEQLVGIILTGHDGR